MGAYHLIDFGTLSPDGLGAFARSALFPRFWLQMRWAGATFSKSKGEPPLLTGTSSSSSNDMGCLFTLPSVGSV